MSVPYLNVNMYNVHETFIAKIEYSSYIVLFYGFGIIFFSWVYSIAWCIHNAKTINKVSNDTSHKGESGSVTKRSIPQLIHTVQAKRSIPHLIQTMQHQGSFKLLEKCECKETAVLHFGGVIPKGAAEVYIGQYVGKEHYIVSALQKTQGRMLTPAAAGLFGNFSWQESNAMPSDVYSNALQCMDYVSVNAVLNRRGLRLWSDQV